MFTMSPEYNPPLRQEDITNSRGTEGNISSVTVFLRDMNDRLFALHVATDANFIATALESANDLTDLEPVFVTPAPSIDDELLAKIINSTMPDVLGSYLVAQEE